MKEKFNSFNEITDSVKAGIGIIYQELALFPDLTVYENIFAGNEVKKGPFVDWNQTIVQATRITEKSKVKSDSRNTDQGIRCRETTARGNCQSFK